MSGRVHPWQAQAEATDTSGEKALAEALRTAVAAGVVRVALVADGFEITGPGEVPLHRSTRTFLTHAPGALARYLGMPGTHIHDNRPRSEPTTDAPTP